MDRGGMSRLREIVRLLGMVVASLLVVFLVIFTAGFLLSWWMGETPGFQWSYHKVKPGMSREEVVEMLGEPDDESPEFHLSQYESFEKEYERAEQSGSEYYCFWYRGIDVTYAVGFDNEDRVTMKALGGT